MIEGITLKKNYLYRLFFYGRAYGFETHYGRWYCDNARIGSSFIILLQFITSHYVSQSIDQIERILDPTVHTIGFAYTISQNSRVHRTLFFHFTYGRTHREFLSRIDATDSTSPLSNKRDQFSKRCEAYYYILAFSNGDRFVKKKID